MHISAQFTQNENVNYYYFVKKVSLLRWTIFGYFWVPTDEQGLEKLTVVPAAATLGFVSRVLMNDIWKLR